MLVCGCEHLKSSSTDPLAFRSVFLAGLELAVLVGETTFEADELAVQFLDLGLVLDAIILVALNSLSAKSLEYSWMFIPSTENDSCLCRCSISSPSGLARRQTHDA